MFPAICLRIDSAEVWSYTREFEIPPHSIYVLTINALQKDYKYQEITADEVFANLYVNTFMVGPNVPLKVEYRVKRK